MFPTVKRRRVNALFVGGLVAVATFAPGGIAVAAPAPPASCMGHEASAISPPGSSDEFPGGMPAFKAFIDEHFPGLPPGVVYRTIAQLHEGSHEACDEALEE